MRKVMLSMVKMLMVTIRLLMFRMVMHKCSRSSWGTKEEATWELGTIFFEMTSYAMVLAWLCRSWEAFGDLWKMRVLGVFGQERACWAVAGLRPGDRENIWLSNCPPETARGGWAESAPWLSIDERSNKEYQKCQTECEQVLKSAKSTKYKKVKLQQI